jgi:purine-binding chemotaxis protein CheW
MPGLHAAGSDVVLIVRSGTRHCALRAAHVVEIMRPLPLEPFASAPGLVLGLSVIRGVPVPVVDLAGLLGGGMAGNGGGISRFVSLRVDKRCVALAVEEVLDLRKLDASLLDGLPPLLAGQSGAMDAIGILDSQLLLLLGTARLVPEEAWAELEKAGE